MRKAMMVLAAVGANAALAAPALLAGLERGRWVVTSRDGGPSRALCLGNTAQLVQLGEAARTLALFGELGEPAPDAYAGGDEIH